ncbi:hypothetical protein [Pelomonas sp. SE-A7]|uniref:hypothetical protein n=1 Tax=Pelomonas sp. SE-A7 TaxID=3054953 RepID=UPI00259C9FCA|nr:hypothetical protein [Pelomonas sp. SE-A7]MDM4766222.1 hypothetical protein [Pelomonas sp. SE-A7]
MRRSGRRLVSLFSGVGLYLAAQAMGQYLGRNGVPRSWVTLFGARGSLSVQIAEALILALPVFAFCLVWAWLTVRPWGRARHAHTAWCVAGVGLGVVGWLLFGVIRFALNPPASEVPVSYMLMRYSQAPLFGAQFSLAALLGLALAAWGVDRYLRKHPPRRSRRHDMGFKAPEALGPISTSPPAANS